jgi:hypothetical protein
VFLDYQLEFECRHYSEPHRLIGKSVDLRITRHVIEVFCWDQSVAKHLKASCSWRFITEAMIQAARHRAVMELSHEQLIERSEAKGPATAQLLREQVGWRAHPDEALRASLAILRLAHDFSPSLRLRGQRLVAPSPKRAAVDKEAAPWGDVTA